MRRVRLRSASPLPLLGLALVLSLAGCAASASPVPPATAVADPALPPPRPVVPAAPPPSSRADIAALPYGEAYRAILAQMVAVDTSHGEETKLLEPVAQMYRDAGVSVQMLEAVPGRGNLIARLKGSGAKKPLLLIAHVDVVPVAGQPWTVPPFALTEKDGFLWGRGVNDDKSMAAAIVALTLDLARKKTPLSRDVIVALTAGEETGGKEGARWLTEHHPELLDAEIALNEGGVALLDDAGAHVLAVNLTVSEKFFQTYHLSVKGKGGHSSQPPTSGDPVVTLARALLKVGSYRFTPRVLPEAKAAFSSEVATAEPEYAAALKRVVASAPRISPADDAILSRSAAYNSRYRTTCVTTMLKGSPQDNVLPTTAEATVNCRILPGETVDQVTAQLTRVIGDANVEITLSPDNGSGPASPYEGEVVEAVKKVSATAYPGAVVLPAMMTGASDSRYLRKIGIHAYGVTPSTVSRAEEKAGHSWHGADERYRASWFVPAAEFFRQVVLTLAQ
jgi:acetylornithine deacetylase/succinyl-diaminopimelate desuccinylase-like protein